MTIARTIADDSRWTRRLESLETFSDDLGVMGTCVGPRTGPVKRTHGDKEDYALRRLLVAWKLSGDLQFPVDLRAETERPGEPDFVLLQPNKLELGVEVTEAGREDYQAWLTRTERLPDDNVELLPGDGWAGDGMEEEAARDIRHAIAGKVEKFKHGKYRGPPNCDLVIYDNTATGGFVDIRRVLRLIGRPHELLGGFRQIHLVRDTWVLIDMFGNSRSFVDLRNDYDIDYAAWVFEQVERLRGRDGGEDLDWGRIAEELGSLGRSERHALRSHLRNLLLHLIKWERQPNRRSRSWRISITNARNEITELLWESPSLRGEVELEIKRQFPRARILASQETGMALDILPETCPWDEKEVLDSTFMLGTEDG